MNRIITFLVLTFFISSCEKTKVEVEDIPDPINGVSEYLLIKEVANSPGFTRTKEYTYDNYGVLISDNIKVYPQNLNSLDAPYVIENGTRKLYCDTEKKVTKEVNNGVTYFYTYNDENRLSQEVRITGPNAPNDTTNYIYNLSNPILISYSTSAKQYTKYPGHTSYTYLGNVSYTYYFSNSDELKSWITYPYNYGKIIKKIKVKEIFYRTYAGRLNEIPFYNTIDPNGLVTKLESPNNNNPYRVEYFYKKL